MVISRFYDMNFFSKVYFSDIQLLATNTDNFIILNAYMPLTMNTITFKDVYKIFQNEIQYAYKEIVY